MDKVNVDIIFPCERSQEPRWWAEIMSILLNEEKEGIASINHIFYFPNGFPDTRKSAVIMDNRQLKADVNRNKGATDFMRSESEWAVWLDTDVVPPQGFITDLLNTKRKWVSGIYHLKSEPYPPIAYLRVDNGKYMPIENYRYGELIQVDAIGFGCTLIHKSVYQDIYDQTKLLIFPDGSVRLVHESDIHESIKRKARNRNTGKSMNVIHNIEAEGLYGNNFISPVNMIDKSNYPEPYPFYALTYNRTEDLYFCEIAEKCGHKPYVDTAIQCKHLGQGVIEYGDFANERRKRQYEAAEVTNT